MTPVRNEENKHSPGNWYVIRTQPQADHLAAVELHQAGYEVFSPRMKNLHPKMGNSDAPLFPGYIFLHWDLESRGKPSFQGAPHVAGWVSFDGEVPYLPDEAVTELARRVEKMDSQGGLWHRFKPGERVRVVSRVMQGLADVVEEARSPQSRVTVLMQFMGRRVSAQVPWENLDPVERVTEPTLRAPRRTRGRGRWIQGFGPRAVGGIQA
jgi:transcriptional antiterminator RfaH